ncbi:MAG: restriction endonuclease subunit S [Prevotella sp.]
MSKLHFVKTDNYIRLKDISDISIGEFVRKDKQNDNYTYPVYNGGTTNTGYYSDYNNEGNKIIISARGAAGFVNRVFARYWAGNSCYSIKITSKSFNWHFVYYFLKQQQNTLIKLQQTGSIPSVSKKQVEDICIPNVNIKVQEEIVKILDSFTNLIDALNEELSLRQKQFEYYREKLLTFDDKSYSKTINEIGTLYRGNGLQKKDFVEEGIGCIHYGQIYTKLGFSLSKPLTFVTEDTARPLTKVRKGDLVIACTSENIEDVCKSVVWEGDDEIVTGGHACVFRHNENPRYIGYYFQTHQFFLQKKQYAYGAKVIDIKTEKLGEILIPIPSKREQNAIVEKLDAFESLISSLKEEIALRQKQYEYYREKLLTFE